MADLFEDLEYVEACRVAAWADRSSRELTRYWNEDTKDFNFPEGWPDGIQSDIYVREQQARYTPPPPDTSVLTFRPLSPSVRRLREMLR